MATHLSNQIDAHDDFDLNSIVKVNCNFELLKKIIEMLIAGQKELKTQVDGVEDAIANMPQVSPKNASGYVHPSEDSDLFESEDYDDITNKLIKRIGKIKKRLMYLEENAQVNEKKFIDVQCELTQRQNEIEQHKKDIMDIRIHSGLDSGNVGNNEDGKGVESVMRLVKELERTYQQKFANVDDRIRNIEKKYPCGVADNNDNTQNVIVNGNSNSNRMEENQTQTEHIYMHDTLSPNNNSNSYNNTYMNSNINNNELYNSFQKQIMTLSSDIQNLKLLHNNKSALFERNLKDLQTSIQTSLSQIKPSLDKIPLLLPTSDFLKFQDTITFKLESDVRDLRLELVLQKKSLDNFKEQLITLIEDTTVSEELHGMKRRLEAFMTQLHVLRDSLKKFEEQLSSKPQFDPTKYIDLTQFNEFKQTLGKQFANTTAQIESVNSIVDDLISNVLKNKAAFKDLKNLEDTVMLKIEEMRTASIKLFADKNEMNKNIKYLETQIKNAMEYAANAKGKGNDSWLIAKKPIGGHLCASCETYIGELSNHTSYVPWNKIPNKEAGDKLYRIGTGFSKMLQMVNVDQNNNTIMVSPRDTTTERKVNGSGNDVAGCHGSKDELQGYEGTNVNVKDETININNNQYMSNLNGSHSLPQIKGKRKMNVASMEGCYGKDEVVGLHLEEARLDENEERNKPKITKVIKKQK